MELAQGDEQRWNVLAERKLQVDLPTLTGPCSLGPEQHVSIALVGDSDASKTSHCG